MSQINSANVSVILVEPTQPGNVGAVARAMDNMGVSDLRLVNPCQYFHPEARMFAMNARHLLHQANVFSSLKEALKGVNLIIGTSARQREKIQTLSNLNKIPAILSPYPKETTVALVFGTEQSGLDNEAMSLCNEWVYIPTYGTNSSLNLAQSVLIVLFELSKHYDSLPSMEEKLILPAPSEKIESMKDHFFQILEATGFIRGTTKNSLWNSFSNLIGRAKPDERDVNMIRGFFNRIEITLKQKNNDQA
jgi:TrmH family RNA methyltransferase